jgi:8-oxo-dGTP diphosphatase
MEEIKNEIIHSFGNKLRIRVCGICMEENTVLLVKHHSIGESGILWAPPGGGMVFGETAEDALKREFLEETGLIISVEKFLCVNEYLTPPLHAIELFFVVNKTGGTLKMGIDPELQADKQIITELTWTAIDQIQHIPKNEIHSLFQNIKNKEDLSSLNGYFN